MPFSKQFEGPSFCNFYVGATLSLSNGKLFQLYHPSILVLQFDISLVQLTAGQVWGIFNIQTFNLLLDKCEEYYCSLGIPTTDSTSSKSFLCNFGQIFLLINLNWTQCAFQSWDLFLGKYFNYSNITLPNPVGNENSIVLGILRTDCVPALIFQALVEQIWAG